MTGVAPVVRLSGDVARQFAHLPVEQAVEAVATHLSRFWEPRMLRDLVSRVQADEPGIDPLVGRTVRERLAADPGPTDRRA
ncbi:MAG: formate dehydrogenase subunit delta [Actinomycetales bacterium]|nr:formate dehydrogenase subunit delta [Candidatus Phosphoribacter baldrii]MBK6955454.1 formate dehydrogenase subunit delta [Candidatus Phosphoribacter baldrii]MBK7610733.1 formate dehydrogenase subunit delta [Candidatus Phosphoribacter baldrii]